MKSPILLLAALLPAWLPSARADLMSIPYTNDELWEIYEPTQDAIIVWDGQYELIYLQTQLRGSSEGRVLEAMPLPSRPKVSKANPHVFRRMEVLLPMTKQKPPPEDVHRGGVFGGGGDAAVVHEQVVIGAHNIYIVEMKDMEHFTEWVLDRMKKDGAKADTIPAALDEVLREYMRDGYKWFIFDLVTVYPEVRVKEPLLIEFASDKLYYPMRLTRVEKGDTEVNLSVLTPYVFEAKHFLGLNAKHFRLRSAIKTVTAEDMKFVDDYLWKRMGKPAQAYVRPWRISGKLNSFKADVVIAKPY